MKRRVRNGKNEYQTSSIEMVTDSSTLTYIAFQNKLLRMLPLGWHLTKIESIANYLRTDHHTAVSWDVAPGRVLLSDYWVSLNVYEDLRNLKWFYIMNWISRAALDSERGRLITQWEEKRMKELPPHTGLQKHVWIRGRDSRAMCSGIIPGLSHWCGKGSAINVQSYYLFNPVSS